VIDFDHKEPSYNILNRNFRGAAHPQMDEAAARSFAKNRAGFSGEKSENDETLLLRLLEGQP
jgi:hypothetical protein